MIDPDEFAKIAPNLSALRRTQILPALQAAMTKFGITTQKREAHFISQCGHESGGFIYKRELASGRAYEGRRDLGNTQPGDGVRYKGRGFIQLTGRSNYRRFGAAIGADLEAHPELAETDGNAALLAAAYWDSRKLNAKADRDDFLGITRAINGGTNGLADRRARLAVARQVLSLDDPEPAEDDDAGAPVPLWLRGSDLPFDGELANGTTIAPLRALATVLGLTIQATANESALLSRNGETHAETVPLEIRGSVGWSPVRAVAACAGLAVALRAGRVEIG